MAQHSNIAIAIALNGDRGSH